MKNKEYIKDKERLERFYSGETSREEERQLAGQDSPFFDPLLSSLDTAREELVTSCEMPERYRLRIAEALDEEMRLERVRRNRIRKLMAGIGAASAAAAAAVLLLLTVFRVGNPSEPAADNEVFAEHRNTGVEANVDTRVDTSVEANIDNDVDAGRDTNAGSVVDKAEVNPAEESVASGLKAIDRKSRVSSHHQNIAKVEHGVIEEKGEVDDTAETEDWVYLSEDEEMQLRATNYKIVENPAEAMTVVNAVFSRLDVNLIEGRSAYETALTKFDDKIIAPESNSI